MILFNRRAAVILHDFLMVAVAWEGAVLLRYLFAPLTAAQLLGMLQIQVLPVVLLVQSLILWHYGLYRGLWRFASLPDLWNILRSVVLGTLAITLTLVLLDHLHGIPRGTFVFYPFLLILLLGAPRLLYRLWKEHSLDFLLERIPDTRALIIGAGQAGEMLVRDMRRNRDYQPVGFLDDEPRLRHGKLHGVPILGATEDLEEVVRKLEVDLIIIAMPSATDRQMRRIVELCERTRVPFRTLPRLETMMESPEASLQALREVSIDDLLGREKIELDWSVIERGLQGRVVMVSGAGGSIGAELCRQIARLKPAALILYERCEYNLYRVDWNLREEFPELSLHTCLADACDRRAVENCLSRYQPGVIFHAAAHKHVPLLEGQIREAARNNIFGTRVMAGAAVTHGCEGFVLISTDKAVNPTNIMGSTKRVAELYCQALNNQGGTRFFTVRFGNVLGSAGSVVPLFQKQIARGGPVTVTHPQITRYFMTIPEACQLILQAVSMGQGGEIFVLDMGRPIKIQYLAEQLIRLSGKLPNKDIKIEYIGLRPGEKLHEELFHADEEQFSRTRHNKIMLASARGGNWREIEQALEDMAAAVDNWNETEILRLLKQLVPEYLGFETKDGP